MPRKPPTTRQKYGPKNKDTRGPRVYSRVRHKRWRKAVLERDHYICQQCGGPGDQADHIVPLSKGGTWQLSNGQALCASCHSRKTRRGHV